MPVNSYEIGQLVTLKSAFVDPNNNNNPIDPSAITLRIRTPDGNIQVFTYAASQLTKVSIGVYSYDFNIIMQGLHRYRFEGTGTCQAVDEQTFSVRDSKIITG